MQKEAKGGSVDQVGVRGALQDVPQGLLAAEDNFKRQVFFDAGYEKPQIGQALGIDEMGLVDEQECELFILFEAGKDLKQHAVFAHFGFFTELGEDEPQEAVGPDGSEMKIQRLIAVLGKLVDKEPEQGRLAHAGCSEDQGDFALLFEELEPGQGLLHAGVALQPLDRGFFGEGMGGEGEVLKKH